MYILLFGGQFYIIFFSNWIFYIRNYLRLKNLWYTIHTPVEVMLV